MISEESMDEQNENVDESDEEERPIIALHLMPSVAYSAFFRLK